jgi:hypothetical protein
MYVNVNPLLKENTIYSADDLHNCYFSVYKSTRENYTNRIMTQA